jgi:hypothetical protein
MLGGFDEAGHNVAGSPDWFDDQASTVGQLAGAVLGIYQAG